jgi:ABC-type multidrug transport system fused ATPase/permease subunit
VIGRGVQPLLFSALTLVVMFTILVGIDQQLALVSLAIVPVLFLWIRWSTRRLRPRAERTPALESRLSARLHETVAAIHLVKRFARESMVRCQVSIPDRRVRFAEPGLRFQIGNQCEA